MKQGSTVVVMMLTMLIAMAFSVSAAVTVVDTFDAAKPTFGGPSQAASNPRDDNAGSREVLATTSIRFKNSDPATITATLEFQAAAPFSSNDIRLEAQSPLNLTGNNAETAVSFRARIPEKLDAVDVKGEPAAFKVGTAILRDSANADLVRFDVFMRRENNLEMTDLDATIDGKGRKSLGDDDTLENLKPGDRIEIEAEASNRFDKDTNLDVEDITLEIECDSEDNFDFDDKTKDFGDLAPEDEETETITFDIEPDAQDEDSSCLIKIIGRDQNGARHGEGTNFDIEVTRESHDIQITSAIINPTSVSCTQRELQLTVDLLNLGRSDEDRVALEVISKAISFQERVSNIEMDEDDSQQEIFVIPISPAQLKPGPFAIQVQTFYDNTKSSDTQTVQVDNLCTTTTTTGGDTTTGGAKPIVQGALEVESESIQIDRGGSTSIPVKVTNLEKTPVEYTVALADISEFAETAASKTIFLNPSQQSTVLLNVRSKDDIELGKYSGIIVLKDSAGKTLETKTFTVDVIRKEGNGFDISSWFSGSDSRIFWIIGDIILIIVAIFFIRLIFTGGKKKQQQKKLADYEAEMAAKRFKPRRGRRPK